MKPAAPEYSSGEPAEPSIGLILFAIVLGLGYRICLWIRKALGYGDPSL